VRGISKPASKFIDGAPCLAAGVREVNRIDISADCDSSAREQIIDHIVVHCQIHRLHLRVHDMTVLDDKTFECLLNTCPEI